MRENFWCWAKPVLIAIGALAIGFAGFALTRSKPVPEPIAPVISAVKPNPERKVIGKSVEGRDVEAFTFSRSLTSTGRKLLFVGGIHGGYEWNSVLLAYAFMDYLEANPSAIPDGLSVTVIPNLNPDGTYKIVGKEGRFNLTHVSTTIDQSTGRFNAHGVDLNRNFDCKWQPTGTWRSKTVSAGSKPFSEPEALALRDYVLESKPDAAVFYHSQANAVYASQCSKSILPETRDIMNTYAKAAGYPAISTFDAYELHGAAEDWLASLGIPAITVELKTHQNVEREKNLLGIKALFEYYR